MRVLFNVKLPKRGPFSRIIEHPLGRYAMLNAHGCMIELLEETEGPNADFLKEMEMEQYLKSVSE
jgi:hypothetical protein